MKTIINYLFPKKSQWFDIGTFESSGEYKLIQMRYNLDNNKKSFRVVSMGFVNDHAQRAKIYEKVLSIGAESNYKEIPNVSDDFVQILKERMKLT